MAWRQIGDKPLSEQIHGLASNRRQAIIWTNADQFTDAYM